jgi:hypothetical protein
MKENGGLCFGCAYQGSFKIELIAEPSTMGLALLHNLLIHIPASVIGLGQS